MTGKGQIPTIDRTQCKGCLYWRPCSGCAQVYYGCHHLLETGKSRKREGTLCLSRIPKSTRKAEKGR